MPAPLSIFVFQVIDLACYDNLLLPMGTKSVFSKPQFRCASRIVLNVGVIFPVH